MGIHFLEEVVDMRDGKSKDCGYGVGGGDGEGESEVNVC